MTILLFGSIASGKTTIAKKLINQHSYLKYFSIDNFRKEYGDNSMEKEIIAQKKFLEEISKPGNNIIEASGLGKLGKDILEIVSQQKTNILLVILYLDKDKIQKHLSSRKWDIPFPDKQKRLSNIISTINYGIQMGQIPMMWSENANTTIIQIENKNLKTQEFILNTINNYLKLNK